MKSFVVIGMGRFGSNLTKTLAELGHEVLAIDEDIKKIQEISNYVTNAVVCDYRDENALKSLGIRNFDCAVIAISNDVEANIFLTLMLKDMGVPYVMAKAVTDLHARVLTQVGADKVVFPEKDMGFKVAQSLTAANILDFIDLSDEYSIVELKMPSKWTGKSLRQLKLRTEYGINVVAMKNLEDDSIDISPNPDYIFKENDILVIIGSSNDISKIPS
ncbi:MAG: potassium transporter Trk [Clostridia bacterium]|nr:potassium transporter Trk [Clostridia bacterium]